MMRPILAGLAAAMLLAAPAVASVHATLPQRDARFLLNSTRAGAYERALSEIAARRTRSKPIFHFALQDIYDHEKLRIEAERLARTYDIRLDTTLTAWQQHRLARLRRLSGRAFNNAYIQDLRQINLSERPRFQREAEGIQNHQLQQYLEQAQDDDQAHEHRLDRLRIAAADARAARIERRLDAGL